MKKKMLSLVWALIVTCISSVGSADDWAAQRQKERDGDRVMGETMIQIANSDVNLKQIDILRSRDWGNLQDPSFIKKLDITFEILKKGVLRNLSDLKKLGHGDEPAQVSKSMTELQNERVEAVVQRNREESNADDLRALGAAGKPVH
jgi:hypothetical protein